MEHLTNGYLQAVNKMFDNVLKPKIEKLRLSSIDNYAKITVEYFNAGKFVFSLQGEKLFEYYIKNTKEKYFHPMETFIFVLWKNNIDIEEDVVLNCNADYIINIII